MFNKLKKSLIILVIFVLSISNNNNNNLFSQEIEISGTNTVKFGSGTEWAGTDKDIEVDRQYLEDWIDIDIVRGDFSMGFRFEASEESEFGETFKRFPHKYFAFTKENYSVRVGDFYGIFGRGTVLDLREEKANFFNNSVSGVKTDFENDYFFVQALGGKGDFRYINDEDPLNQIIEEMSNSIMGVDGNFSITDIFEIDDYSFNLGLSYLYMEGDESVSDTQYLYDVSFVKKSEIGALNFTANLFDFEFYNEYAIKNTYTSPAKKGWANYSSLSYGSKGIGITLEFKDYYQFASNPNHVKSNFSPYQNPAQVIIDHSSHLLKNNLHIANGNDEIGYQIQLRSSIIENIDLSLIAAFSSLHDEDSMIPKFDDESYLPYRDIWFDGRYNFKHSSLLLGAGYNHDTPTLKGTNYNTIPGVTSSDDIYSYTRTTFMGEYDFEIDENSAFKLLSDFQLVEKKADATTHDWNDIFFSIEYSYSKYGYINISVINTSEEVPEDSPDTWIGYEAGLKLSENHKLELFYGRERAGIKCSGGSCRQVPEFDGFKLTLTSSF